MKSAFSLIFILIFFSCSDSTNSIIGLKYSENDLIQLNDSLQALVMSSAAGVECQQILTDSTKSKTQISLDQANIDQFYNDIVRIYNNSYSISNAFFEKNLSIICDNSRYLFELDLSVDTNKTWVDNWIIGNEITGISLLDSLIISLNLQIRNNLSHWDHSFTLISQKAINMYALEHQLKNTGEFKYVGSDFGFIASDGGSVFLMSSDNNTKLYKYLFTWGDCPSGCLNYHYWIIELTESEVSLVEEAGYLTN